MQEKVALTLVNNDNIESIQINIKYINREYYKYIELLLSNKINLKFLEVDLEKTEENINYLIKGLSCPFKKELHTFIISFNSKQCNYTNLKEFYNFFKNNYNKLSNLRVLEIYITNFSENSKIDSLIKNMELSLIKYNNLHKYFINLDNIDKHKLDLNCELHNSKICCVNKSITYLSINVNLYELYISNYFYYLANEFKNKNVKTYFLNILDSSYNNTSNIYLNNLTKYNSLLKDIKANYMLYDNTTKTSNIIDVNNANDTINTLFINLLPSSNLESIDYSMQDVNTEQLGLIMDNLLFNSNTLNTVKLNLIFINILNFHNLDKFILLIKSLKKTKILYVRFINFLTEKFNNFIIFLIMIYCESIEIIKFQSMNSNKDYTYNKNISLLYSRLDELEHN